MHPIDRAKLLNKHAIVLIGYLGLVLLVNWPLVANIRTHIVGRSFDDAFEVLWQLSWMKTAVFEQRVNPFYTPDIFYPQGWHIASGAQPGWFLILFAPLTYFIGAILTYNLLLVGSFAVAGFGAYLFAYQLTRRRLSGFIAGCVYISAPVLTVRLGGHTHILFSMAFLPYATLSFFRALRQDERHWAWIILAGIALTLTILGMWYFVFIATLPLIVFSLFLDTNITWRERILRLTMIFLITFLSILPFALATWHARQIMYPGEGGFSFVVSDSYGISPDRLVVPNPSHPLWGDWSKEQFPVGGEHHVVAVGYAALIVGAIGVVRTKWQYTRPFVMMGTLALVLAMGLTLQWNGTRIVLSAPLPIAKALQSLYPDVTFSPNKVAIPLPGLLLYHLLPFYAAMRVWARFTIPFVLAIAVLGAYGANFLAAKGRVWRFVVVVVGLLIIFEGLVAPYASFTEVSQNDRSANQWLAAQPDGSALIEYPRPTVDKIAMYSQSFHGQPLVNGYMSILPTYLQSVSVKLGEWPNPDGLQVLREWGVQYVLVNGLSSDREFQKETLPRINSLEGLCQIQTYDDGFMFFDQTRIYKLMSPQDVCPD